MATKIELPKCCGKTMCIRSETIKFLEAWCNICLDFVYIKKMNTEKTQLIDD